jgi:hypothetical protein
MSFVCRTVLIDGDAEEPNSAAETMLPAAQLTGLQGQRIRF